MSRLMIEAVANYDEETPVPVALGGVLGTAAMALAPQVERSDRMLRAGALSIAVMAHAVALALALPAETDRLGDGAVELDSVTVSIVMKAPSPVGAPDVVHAAPVDEPTADSGPVAPIEPRAEQETDIESERKAERKTEPGPPAPIDDATTQQPIEVPPPEPKPEPPAVVETPAPTVPPPAPQQVATARASAGVMRAYARQVALSLARARPKGTGQRGTVRIRFVVDGNGNARDAEIVGSSGSPRLDRTALSAVGRVTFPRPPVEASVPQRTFLVPFQFR